MQKYEESTTHRYGPKFTSGGTFACTVMPKSDAAQLSRKAAENTKGRGNSPASAMATSDSRARGAYTSIAPATNSVVPVGKLPSTMLTATHAGTAKRSISITNGLFNRIAQSATTTADATMAPVYSLRPAPTSASNE